MSEHYFSLLWVLRCLLQTRCELGLIVVVIKTSKNLGTMKSQTKKKYFMCLADSYVFGLALVARRPPSARPPPTNRAQAHRPPLTARL